MLPTKFSKRTLLVACAWLTLGVVQWAEAQEGAPAERKLNADNFSQLHSQIKPQAGESRWMEISWFLDLHEARQKAAAEGKPLFIYSTGGATGIGAC